MATSDRPDKPQRQRRLPGTKQNRLPKGHLTPFVCDSVDSSGLSVFRTRYAKGEPRNQPLHHETRRWVAVHLTSMDAYRAVSAASIQVADRSLTTDLHPFITTVRQPTELAGKAWVND